MYSGRHKTIDEDNEALKAKQSVRLGWTAGGSMWRVFDTKLLLELKIHNKLILPIATHAILRQIRVITSSFLLDLFTSLSSSVSASLRSVVAIMQLQLQQIVIQSDEEGCV